MSATSANSFASGGIVDSGQPLAEGLFDGDTGTLTLPQRQVLVKVLQHSVISRDKYPAEWMTLQQSRAIIVSRLNDLFLDLVVDHTHEVAYKVQVGSPTPGVFPRLLRDVAYTREETILLIEVRQHFLNERSAGVRRVIVDREWLLGAGGRYRPASDTDKAGSARRFERAIETLTSLGVLVAAGNNDRIEISGAIETVLPLAKLQSLLDWLRKENSPRSTFDRASRPVEDCENSPERGAESTLGVESDSTTPEQAV